MALAAEAGETSRSLRQRVWNMTSGHAYSTYIGDVLGLVAGSDDADDSGSVGRLDGVVKSRGDATTYR